MKAVVVGLGIQGKKRLSIAGPEAVAVVDPIHPEAVYKQIEDVPLDAFDAALVCTPDSAKIPILRYLIENGKHLLVEKPLLAKSVAELIELRKVAEERRIVCYTAYNHRFEPHIENLRKLITSDRLGKIYSAKFFYGNGTARDARNSPWRDQGTGVLPDLGSHLLDMTLYLFGEVNGSCRPWRADRFENRAYDHFMFGFHGDLPIDYELSLLSYRNTFLADVYGELGSAHINCLCKWGPSTLSVRRRVFPSGRPNEEATTLVCQDPTWAAEYVHFKSLCQCPSTNLGNDVWIQSKLEEVTRALA